MLFEKNHDNFESEIQSGIQIIPKNLGFSEKRLDFQAFQKSGLEPVARAKYICHQLNNWMSNGLFNRRTYYPPQRIYYIGR